MMTGQLILYMNVIIIVSLMMFIGLLVPQMKLLLKDNNEQKENTPPTVNKIIISNHKKELDYRKLQLCPGNYKHLMKTIFLNYYDKNCTYLSVKNDDKIEENIIKNNDMIYYNETEKKIITNTNNYIAKGTKIVKPKSVQVADYILALMLIVSVIGAFVELLRNRFVHLQDPTMRVRSFESRQSSIEDLVLQRRSITRGSYQLQRSFDIGNSPRIPIRATGALTSSRRSSCPIYFSPDLDVNDCPTPPLSPRRQSINVGNETSIGISSGLHRRTHLIRRY